jgi:hypothetical protein
VRRGHCHLISVRGGEAAKDLVGDRRQGFVPVRGGRSDQAFPVEMHRGQLSITLLLGWLCYLRTSQMGVGSSSS